MPGRSCGIIRSDLKFHRHSLQWEVKAPGRTGRRSVSRARHQGPTAPGHAGAQEAAEWGALNAASQCITSHRGKMSLCQMLLYQETDARQLWVAEGGLDTSDARPGQQGAEQHCGHICCSA